MLRPYVREANLDLVVRFLEHFDRVVEKAIEGAEDQVMGDA